MQKILSAKQIREADLYTIKNEPISSIDLMERAAQAFADRFVQIVSKQKSVFVVCGVGNNGGDGLAITRLLRETGYQVDCLLIRYGSLSDDCQINLNRLDGKVKEVQPRGLVIDACDVIIDALFGSGLNRPVEGDLSEVIRQINSAPCQVVSVDIPSGLFADEVNLSGAIIRADYTITFQLPKLSFLIPETGKYAGYWWNEDIGLNKEFISNQESNYYLMDRSVKDFLPHRGRFQHKGDFGRVQVFAGSLGKMGAAVLCATAVMKSGAGLLTVHIPECGMTIMQTALPEAMVTLDRSYGHLSSGELMENTDVVCIGPGIGQHDDTRRTLLNILHDNPKRLVIDADGLNILAQHSELMDLLPEGTVLTPHVGEFERLFGEKENGLERIRLAQHVAFKRKWVIVLKGANTAVITPKAEVYFNTTGNPGMATAGSGDVLAGVITGLLAQGLSPVDAALLGVYIHGEAGDIAEKTIGETSLMASDLLNFIHETFCND
ncbi:NAD(P)H-hydrate dehydratase [Roseivirga sp.]|uniref:NAD(P)H-hydrate dehydratase n=1 Tax=Roseivirga sp. TaxID=1964215 RepID=UPI003B518850